LRTEEEGRGKRVINGEGMKEEKKRKTERKIARKLRKAGSVKKMMIR